MNMMYIRFFEWARSWSLSGDIVEKKLLTGIFYRKQHVLNFYDVKAQLQHLLRSLHYR